MILRGRLYYANLSSQDFFSETIVGKILGFEKNKK